MDLLKHFIKKDRWSKGMGSHAYACDICGAPIIDYHIDGKTQMGPWADMCPECHKTHGVGLGVGKGQKYKSGKKVEG